MIDAYAVQLDDPGQVWEAGWLIAAAARDVATRSDSVRSGWQGLGAHYSAPEQGLVLAAMNVPQQQADELSDKSAQAQTALSSYAEALTALRSRRAVLAADIADFYADKAATEADNADNHWWDTGLDWATGEDHDLLVREEALEGRVGQLQADKDAAERACGNAIGAIWGAPDYSAAGDTWSGDQNAYGTTAEGYEQMALNGDTPWGHPEMWSEGDWTTKTFMLGRGGVRTVTGVVEFAGDAVGFGGAGKAKALWSGVGQLGLDSLIVSGPASYLFTSAEQRAESSERLVGVGKGLIGWDTWDTSGWNTAGGLGLDALLTLGTGGGYAGAKAGLKGARTASLAATLRSTRAGTLATATTAVITTRGAASLNKIKTYATHTDRRLMTALNNLGPRPAYAGGITPGSATDNFILRMDDGDAAIGRDGSTGGTAVDSSSTSHQDSSGELSPIEPKGTFRVPGTESEIPRDTYEGVREASVHNTNANQVMLGRYDGGGESGYISRAGADYRYFDLGRDWNQIKQSQGLTDAEMFEAYNIPFLDDAIRDGVTVKFSHDPTAGAGFLPQELEYLTRNGYVYDPATMTAKPLG